MKKEMSECVGLWLAEGDSKTKSEVTFTNNCFELIIHFHKVAGSLFDGPDFRPRIYSFSKDKRNLQRLPNIPYKDYFDKRARKPYYIYRFASVKLLKEWKKLVNVILSEEKYYVDILRGFFAGEGNIKNGTQGNRMIRIAQNHPVKFIDTILTKLNVKYRYSTKERTYLIWGRESWDKLNEINVVGLHPEKIKSFNKVYQEFKEYHYSKGHLKKEIFKLTTKAHTSLMLSHLMERSQARVYDVLAELKEEGYIEKFNVRSKVYWINKDQNSIVISSVKQKYLNKMDSCIVTSEFAKEMGVCWKSAFRRLSELKKLELINFKNGKWLKILNEKRVIVVN
nr:hypothetical protein [Candidatus Woesearchaeota archaeon]